MTSEKLAGAMQTNPVVIRRTMAGLRDHGIVRSSKGHGGGWALARDLSRITLRDVYAALGSPALIALGHRSPSPRCLLERAVNARLADAFADAEALLLSRFEDVTLAELAAEVQDRATTRGGRHRMSAHAS